MKLNKIDEVWNSANPHFKWRLGLLSSKNFATMALDVTTSPLHGALQENIQSHLLDSNYWPKGY